MALPDNFAADYITHVSEDWRAEAEPVLEALHGLVFIIWLYRSALVMLPKDEPYSPQEVLVYHDPAWIGEERTPATFQRHCSRLIFQGQRNDVDIFMEVSQCGDGNPRWYGPFYDGLHWHAYKQPTQDELFAAFAALRESAATPGAGDSGSDAPASE